MIECEEIGGDHELLAIAERILAAMAEPFRVGDKELVLDASVGIAVSARVARQRRGALAKTDVPGRDIQPFGGGTRHRRLAREVGEQLRPAPAIVLGLVHGRVRPGDELLGIEWRPPRWRTPLKASLVRPHLAWMRTGVEIGTSTVAYRRHVRVAAAQARPCWSDPQATTKKVLAWLEDAAAQGVELVAFPETFLSGYPFWLELTGGARFDDPAQKRAYAAYLEAAVAMDGPEVRQITEAARDLGVLVYLGTTERATGSARGTVFCTLVAIDPGAGVVSTHRKLMPTFEQRLVWGTGDGHGLQVHRYAGSRVGGLNCWENWMPQARHALYAQGE